MIPFWKKTDKGGKKKPQKPAVPRTAQQSIPMQRMFEDGTCRVKANYYTRTIQYQDINYQLAQQEDKTAIFEEWCSFLNFFDSSIKFELSFVNMATDSTEFEKSIRIPFQKDGFDDVRAEYSQMLRQQLAKGNNGLTKTKFITFGVEGESMAQVKPRLDHIQNDLLNNFHRLGVQAKPLNGVQRLKLMHDMFNMDGASKFHFDWKDLVKSGLSVKDAIAPTAFAFKNSRTFQMGGIYCAASFLSITASDISDQLLKDFLDMDGIEKKLVERFHTNALGKVDSRFKNAHKVNFVRYADDFVVTAATPELALEAKELIREFLAERGLELSDEKTVVTNIDDGFDFLGWNFRKYNEKLIIKPSQKAVKAIVSNISDTILRRGKAWQQDVLIMKLNEQIRGWTNYHQSVCASDAFAHLDYVLYELLWRWAKRRHPKKNKWWISTRYWHRVGNRNWVFSTENKELIRVDSTAIVRHTKIKATANPFLDEAYFQKRKFDKGMHRLTGKFKMIWKTQNGLCYHCGMPMDVTEEREIFYLAPKAKTGTEEVRNMRYVHGSCQRIYAENRLKK